MGMLESLFGLDNIEDVEDTEALDNQEQEDVLESPKDDTSQSMAQLLNKAIQDEYTAITLYNEIAGFAREQGLMDVVELIDHINTEENNHVGMLQETLKKFSETANAINDGTEEAYEFVNVPNVVSEGVHNKVLFSYDKDYGTVTVKKDSDGDYRVFVNGEEHGWFKSFKELKDYLVYKKDIPEDAVMMINEAIENQ